MITSPALGWCPDIPDFRDYTVDTPDVQRLLALAPGEQISLPGAVDLRESFPEVDDQSRLKTSPAHACVGLYEYFERRAHGRLSSLSRLFLHHNTQQLLGVSGNSSTGLRSTLKAMTRFGVPPERLWPYNLEQPAKTPPPHLYSFSDSFRSLVYLRFDERNSTGSRTLQTVRSFLAAGYPIAFGFVVPESISLDNAIPYRPTFDAACGGQAMIAVGYDDRWLASTRGALLVRNSWGSAWGDGGYGWLPYAYVEQQLATDFWTLLKQDWLQAGEFLRPQSVR